MSKKTAGPVEQRRAFSFEVKEFDDATGIIKGYAATYERDLVNDVIVPGAFKRTLDHLRQKGRPVPFLSQHDRKTVTGWFDPSKCAEDQTGLYFEAHMLLEIKEAHDDYVRAKAGVMYFSIGFDTLEAEIDRKTKTRYLKEVRLREVSLVTFPANEGAVVTEVKGTDFATTLATAQAEQNLREQRWRMDEALWQVLVATMSDEEMADDDKNAIIDTSLGQYHQAMLIWCKAAMAAKLYQQKGGAEPEEVKAGRRHSKSTLEKIEAAKASAESAVEHLKALLGMPMDDDEEATQDQGAADGKKSAPTSGPSADVARLASEITAAAEEQKALGAIRNLQRTMSAT